MRQAAARARSRASTPAGAGRPLAAPAQSALNDRLARMEQTLADDDGAAETKWYRHVFYGWNIYSLYDGQPFPGLAEALRVKDAARVTHELGRISARSIGMAAELTAALARASSSDREPRPAAVRGRADQNRRVKQICRARPLEARPDPRHAAGAASVRRRRRGRRAAHPRPRAHLLGPATPGRKKLDAIDTDQITPAADCVSESLDTLDERWKAGSFRYLMPDFRARVHAGETFVDRRRSLRHRQLARDEPGRPEGRCRGSGPARWSIVCGANMGDIFRRNAFNLGLHVVQSPEAVADARDGDEFTFDPGQPRASSTSRRTRPTRPCPLSAEGGRDPPERRHLRRRAARVPRRRARARRGDLARRGDGARAEHDRADRLGAPGRQGRGGRARARRCACTPICCPRRTAPRRSRSTPSTRSPAATRSTRGRRRSPTTTSSSPARTTTTSRPPSAASSPQFHGIEKPYYADSRRRHLPLLLPGTGARHARAVHPRRRLAQPRVRRLRRRGHGRRLDHARLRLGDRLHLLHDGEAAARALHRPAAAVGHRQGHRARRCCAAGARSSRRACRWSSSTPTGSCR